MKQPECAIRCGRKLVFSSLLLAGAFVPGNAMGFSSSSDPEKIQATYTQNGNPIGVTLNIYEFTTPSEVQALSQAFADGQDQGLAAALSRAKASGNCTIAGDIGFGVAFIQMVVTPSGRQITFITSRQRQSDKVKPGTESESFDLMVGRFEINDTNNSKSTGFLYPASRLVIDGQGKLHYDLAGSPGLLVDVLDSKWAATL